MRVQTYLFVTLLCASSAMAQTLPKPAGRVADLAGVIDPSVEAEIDRRLDQLERQTSSEVAVATVRSLDGMSVDEYANRLFREWGVGQAKQDNGVLVLVAPNEREMRIEVGYGLEGVLPDGLAGQIIREDFLPRFRDDDYSGGIRNGVARVVEVVEKHQVLTAEELAKFNEAPADDMPIYILIPFMGLFVGGGFLMVGIGLRTKTGFPLLFGSLFGGMPLLVSLGLLFSVAAVTLLPFAIGMAVLGFRLGGRPSWRDSFRDEGDGKKSKGGWVMGGGSGGSSSGSSSSSSSSSDSSFGGGSSGGGGASGKW